MHTVDEITEIAITEIEKGCIPAEFDLAHLTGMNAGEIAACQNQNQGANKHLYIPWHDTHRARQNAGGYSREGNAYIAGAGTRKPFCRMFNTVAKIHGANFWFELSNLDIQNQDMWTQNQGMLGIFIPSDTWQKANLPQGFDQREKIELFDGSYEIIHPDLQKKILGFDGFKPFTIAEQKNPIGAYNATRGLVVLFVGASVARTWSGWSKTKRSEKSEPELWNAIIQNAFKVLPTVNHTGTKIQLTAQMLTAYQTAVHWKQLQLNSQNPLVQLRMDYMNRKTHAETTRDKARTELVKHQKELSELRKQLSISREGGRDRIKQAIEHATKSVRQVTELSAVKSVKAIKMGNDPGLEIELNDIVIREVAAKTNRLIPGLNFRVALTGHNSSYKIEFFETHYKKSTLHPHLFYHGGNACWGEAQNMLYKAAQLKDIIMLINVVIRWAANSKQNGGYLTSLRSFPATTLEPGYHAGAWAKHTGKG